jgi:hypothetical protein
MVEDTPLLTSSIIAIGILLSPITLHNVNATVDVSKGRSITISIADEDTERHFMGQQIYGIVKGLRM